MLDELSELDPVTLRTIVAYLSRAVPTMRVTHPELSDEKYRLELAYNLGQRSIAEWFEIAAKRAENNE